MVDIEAVLESLIDQRVYMTFRDDMYHENFYYLRGALGGWLSLQDEREAEVTKQVKPENLILVNPACVQELRKTFPFEGR